MNPTEKAEKAYQDQLRMQAINQRLRLLGVSFPEAKLYCFVRSDLSKSQQGVQAAHGVAQYLLDQHQTSWRNGTLVVLKVLDPEAVTAEARELYGEHAVFSEFREPDLDNQVTCVTGLGWDELARGRVLI